MCRRKHWVLRQHKPLRLIRDGAVWVSGIYISNTYAPHSHHQNDCIKVGSCVSHFDVSLIVCAKSQDSVHKPQFSKRKEGRSGSNRSPSASQPSALPLGHTGSPGVGRDVRFLTLSIQHFLCRLHGVANLPRLLEGFGEAVVAGDMPQQASFPSFDSFQKRFLWALQLVHCSFSG